MEQLTGIDAKFSVSKPVFWPDSSWNKRAKSNTTANIYLRLVCKPGTLQKGTWHFAGDLTYLSSFNPYTTTVKKVVIQSIGLGVRLLVLESWFPFSPIIPGKLFNLFIL